MPTPEQQKEHTKAVISQPGGVLRPLFHLRRLGRRILPVVPDCHAHLLGSPPSAPRAAQAPVLHLPAPAL